MHMNIYMYKVCIWIHAYMMYVYIFMYVHKWILRRTWRMHTCDTYCLCEGNDSMRVAFLRSVHMTESTENNTTQKIHKTEKPMFSRTISTQTKKSIGICTAKYWRWAPRLRGFRGNFEKDKIYSVNCLAHFFIHWSMHISTYTFPKKQNLCFGCTQPEIGDFDVIIGEWVLIRRHLHVYKYMYAYIFVRNVLIYTCIFVMCVNISHENICVRIQCVCRSISIHVSVWHVLKRVCKVMIYFNMYQIFGWICNKDVFINICGCICFQCMQISNEKKCQINSIKQKKHDTYTHKRINMHMCT